MSVLVWLCAKSVVGFHYALSQTHVPNPVGPKAEDVDVERSHTKSSPLILQSTSDSFGTACSPTSNHHQVPDSGINPHQKTPDVFPAATSTWFKFSQPIEPNSSPRNTNIVCDPEETTVTQLTPGNVGGEPVAPPSHRPAAKIADAARADNQAEDIQALQNALEIESEFDS